MRASETTPIAVAILVRGADVDWREGVERLVRGLKACPPGANAAMYALFKGFSSVTDRAVAAGLLAGVTTSLVDLADDAFDIGAYRLFASRIEERRVCFLNGYSEPLAPSWLAKLAANLDLQGVGVTGATGSFESLRAAYAEFPGFPNPHLRSNAFLMDRQRFLEIAEGFQFASKREAFQFESGPASLSAAVRREGLTTVLVGRDGRGYGPEFWPLSGTFRLGAQANLLVADNQTRRYDAMTWAEKREASLRTWGGFINPLRARLTLPSPSTAGAAPSERAGGAE